MKKPLRSIYRKMILDRINLIGAFQLKFRSNVIWPYHIPSFETYTLNSLYGALDDDTRLEYYGDV